MSQTNKIEKLLYKVHFFYLDRVYTLFARKIDPSPDLYNMAIISEIIFRNNPHLYIPEDEQIKSEFAHTKNLFIPLNHIMRIDELENVDLNDISDPTSIKGKSTKSSSTNLIQPIEFFRRPPH